MTLGADAAAARAGEGRVSPFSKKVRLSPFMFFDVLYSLVEKEFPRIKTQYKAIPVKISELPYNKEVPKFPKSNNLVENPLWPRWVQAIISLRAAFLHTPEYDLRVRSSS